MQNDELRIKNDEECNNLHIIGHYSDTSGGVREISLV